MLARRQPGSTLKPFVYALAFEQAAHHAGDAARRFAGADRHRERPVRAAELRPRTSRAGSARARRSARASTCRPCASARCSAPSALRAAATRFGLALPESGGYYGASLALGSADVTLLALTNAYRALANGGVYSATSMLQRPRAAPRPLRVADARAVFLVTDILADNNARARTFGLASPLATRGFAAVKTGTSKDMRDNWCVGFTDRYTIGVWVGNASGAAMHDVSGVSGAAPVWQALAAHLHASAPSRAAGRAGRRRARTRVTSTAALEPARDEVFLAGTRARAAARDAPRSRGARASASPARATAACSRSIPTCRRRRSASPSKASTARGCSTASRSAAPSGCAGRRGRGGTARRCSARDGQDAAERALRGARRRRQAAGGAEGRRGREAGAKAKAGPAAARKPQP